MVQSQQCFFYLIVLVLLRLYDLDCVMNKSNVSRGNIVTRLTG